jgi:Cu/Ag efflux pump CusA
MPPLNEGDLMFMPIADPSISLEENTTIAARQNAALMKFPEVAYVVAKVARADTSTDPAPLNMTETFVPYGPEGGELELVAVFGRDHTELKTRELATVAALTAKGRAADAVPLKVHVHAALNVGANRQEVVEAIMHMLPYAGCVGATGHDPCRRGVCGARPDRRIEQIARPLKCAAYLELVSK